MGQRQLGTWGHTPEDALCLVHTPLRTVSSSADICTLASALVPINFMFLFIWDRPNLDFSSSLLTSQTSLQHYSHFQESFLTLFWNLSIANPSFSSQVEYMAASNLYCTDVCYSVPVLCVDFLACAAPVQRTTLYSRPVTMNASRQSPPVHDSIPHSVSKMVLALLTRPM